MRKYKFRYYKRSIKQMVPVRSMYFGEPELGADGGISVNDGLELLAPNDIMQFTGLKDKNGRDIYEGDILSLDRAPYCSGMEDGDPATVRRDASGGWWPFADNQDGMVYPDPSKSEVIGNIYENPEMAKT